jgi:hypothetical protein
MFAIGDKVICVDASELPKQFKPLQTGKVYTIRDIVSLFASEIGYGSWSNNIHKYSKYGIRLQEIYNGVNLMGMERCYADTRFEKIEDNIVQLKEEKQLEEVA